MQNKMLKQKSAEVERVNLTFEDRVKKRTEELTNQNRQLTEYAFINSHLLRGPLHYQFPFQLVKSVLV